MEPRHVDAMKCRRSDPTQSSGTGSPAPFGPRYLGRFRIGFSRSRTRAQPRTRTGYLVIIDRQQPASVDSLPVRKVCTRYEFRSSQPRFSTRRKVDRCRSTAEYASKNSSAAGDLGRSGTTSSCQCEGLGILETDPIDENALGWLIGSARKTT